MRGMTIEETFRCIPIRVPHSSSENTPVNRLDPSILGPELYFSNRVWQATERLPYGDKTSDLHHELL